MDIINTEIEKLWDINKIFDEQGEIFGYARKIKKMMDEYEDLIFWLSTNSNESLNDIKRMSHGDRIRFQQRLIAHFKEKGNKGSETDGE